MHMRQVTVDGTVRVLRVVRLSVDLWSGEGHRNERGEVFCASVRSMLLETVYPKARSFAQQVLGCRGKFLQGETERNGRSSAPGLVGTRCINRQESCSP